MPTTFKEGDIFAEPGLGALVLGCAASGGLDAGVAAAFKKRWPRLADEHAARAADGRFHLGDVLVFLEGDATVYAVAIQETWRARAKISALARGMRRAVELAGHAGVTRVGVPRIGAGLGGLDWPRVKSVLTEIGAETPIEIVVFEKFVRARPSAAP